MNDGEAVVIGHDTDFERLSGSGRATNMVTAASSVSKARR